MSNTGYKHVIVGLSGGVDSAVAALLLQQQGHQVTGLFMKNWEEDDDDEYCSAAEDLANTEAVCRVIDIPLRTVNFSTEYWHRVFNHFLNEYKDGRTPNPDVLCNQEIKFRAFLEHAIGLGADCIATGHYACIDNAQGYYRLLKSVDKAKDQSYFLYLLGQKELSKSLFPIGHLQKTEVRQIAKAAGLPNFDRKDSTGVCFIGERHFKTFLSRYLPAQPGPIHDTDNKHVGMHDGLMYYTIGQRHGLGIGGAGAAWYVIDKNLKKNILYVAQGENHVMLFSATLQAGMGHWVTGITPKLPLKCQAKIRYRQNDQGCTVSSIENNRLSVSFDIPQRAIAPGQSVVFYQDSECLGGAIIEQAIQQQQLA